MLKWLIHRKVRAFEREHGYDASYMHEVLDTDMGGGFSGTRIEPATLNGLPGFVFHTAEGTETLALEIAEGAIVAIYAIRNPDKVRHLS
jgi:hypothetical protein